MRNRPLPLWTGATLTLLAASAWLTNTALFQQTIQGTTQFTRNLPATLGPWEMVEDLPASHGEILGLETTDIVKRSYMKGRDRVDLVVAHIAHSSRKSAHAQEACLRGAGALVGSLEMVRMKGSPVQAKALSIDLQDRRQWVYYWYKIGDEHTAEYVLSSFKMFLRGLSGGEHGGTTLIRLLTPEARGETKENIAARIEDFTSFLLPNLEKVLP